MCHKLFHIIWGIWWFQRSKDFEAMNAGKLAIWPWLSCPYNEARGLSIFRGWHPKMSWSKRLLLSVRSKSAAEPLFSWESAQLWFLITFVDSMVALISTTGLVESVTANYFLPKIFVSMCFWCDFIWVSFILFMIRYISYVPINSKLINANDQGTLSKFWSEKQM